MAEPDSNAENNHPQGAPSPVGAKPDGATPDGATPDGARPDGARPDGSAPEAVADADQDLTAGVSAEAKESVQEFLAVAAEQNAAANEAVNVAAAEQNAVAAEAAVEASEQNAAAAEQNAAATAAALEASEQNEAANDVAEHDATPVEAAQQIAAAGAANEATDQDGFGPEAEQPGSDSASASTSAVLDSPQEAAPEPAPEATPAAYIAFDDVTKSFGSLHVLKNVTFSIAPGDTLCILGRSGVGKSVSLQILMGFLRPDSGRVLVAGEDICDFPERRLQDLRRKVTMVFQNGALFDSITVGENVAFPLRERHDLAEDQILQVVSGLLEMVGVAGMDNLLPSDLSTGMKRSVAIARALAAQPEAILYDEPTTMVDPLMGHLLANLIGRLKTQLHLTSIVVTHDMRLARQLADRVVFLHEGEARFFGTVAEMDVSPDPILQEFLTMDALVLPT